VNMFGSSTHSRPAWVILSLPARSRTMTKCSFWALATCARLR
jgi:hypothetical protein